ncbi:MAG: DUF3581 family protein [Alkalimonas sp.]|uniref:DUF3581 family protein n=1 Tax=Alkalimonas delamerensis TaxID=265981 RepID=A0ABT9GPD5_9GAMM|nr:DUF3581 family protein [Alkalimonas delamerensis]MCC5851307.1 DUF3581 family protein [Alkalimonas sp.]MDP4528829.1 DUF3581 family protein [Alkalimonas delamerensis]
MFLAPYIQQQDREFCFSRHQGSTFAKKVAGDFNPLHDEDAKRFCVPGDLMFSWLLSQYGISERLCCTFSGMVAADVWLHFEQHDNEIRICDREGKVYLSLTQEGAVSKDMALIEAIATDYVQFSGKNFPHILHPLMQAQQVMIHPQRPMVIYESMTLELTELPECLPQLDLADACLEVAGRRGSALLDFSLACQGKTIGQGRKRMILSNLSPYDGPSMEAMIAEYNRRKDAFAA